MPSCAPAAQPTWAPKRRFTGCRRTKPSDLGETRERVGGSGAKGKDAVFFCFLVFARGTFFLLFLSFFWNSTFLVEQKDPGPTPPTHPTHLTHLGWFQARPKGQPCAGFLQPYSHDPKRPAVTEQKAIATGLSRVALFFFLPPPFFFSW